jgi:hypothetical protein
LVCILLAPLMGVVTIMASVRALKDQSSVQQVMVGGETVTMQRTRRGKVLEEHAYPTAAVAAVDVAWTGPIMLRLEEGSEALKKMQRLAERHRPSVLAMRKAGQTLSANSVKIPADSLTFSERLDIELVLGADIAARTGRSGSDL